MHFQKSKFLVSILFMATFYALAYPVASYSGEDPQRPNGTQGFVGYLNGLLQHRIIGDDELVSLIEAFEKGRVVNPIPHRVTPYGLVFAQSLQQIHYEGLQEYLTRTELDPKVVLDWAESHLKASGRVRERRERAREETLEIFQKIDFNRLQGADPFEYMSTLVTQKHWTTVMGSNPSKFKLGDHTVVLDIQGASVFMQPDNPVEQVSWNDAQNFIQKLNELSRNDDPLLYQLIVDHHSGDRFQLPTRARWLAVATDHGASKGTYFFGDQESELGTYAWYSENSHGTTHPVAELQPFIVDGGVFYDILGNVLEWMEDFQDVPNFQETFSNPCLEKFSRFRGTSREYILSGGRWAASAYGSRTSVDSTAHPNFKSDSLGFRLVRNRVSHE